MPFRYLKTILPGLVILLGTSDLFSQKTPPPFACYYSPDISGDYLCKELKALSYADELDARDILKKVLEPVGLKPNFVLQPCDSIKNCVATIGENGWRYILYDRLFLKDLVGKDNNNWASLSIFAHEVLHHLNQHTHMLKDASLEKKRAMELEADEWSGRILAILGATLEESQSAVNALNYTYDEQFSTHPSKDQRLDAIERGYRAGKLQNGNKKPKAGFVIDNLVMQEHSFLKINIELGPDSLCQQGWLLRDIINPPDGLYGFFSKQDSIEPGQKYYIAKNQKDLEQQIKKANGWITSINVFDQVWIAVQDSSTRGTNLPIRMAKKIDLNEIALNKANGKVIKDLTFQNGNWFFAEGNMDSLGISDQIIFINDVYPAQEVKQLWKSFYVVSECKFLGNQWVTILNKYENNMQVIVQVAGFNTNMPVTEFIKFEQDGFRLNSIEFDGTSWVYIMNKKKNFTYENTRN